MKLITIFSILALAGCANNNLLSHDANYDPAITQTTQAEKQRKADEERLTQAIRLATIKKIYLGDFGNSEQADLIREKVRIRLIDFSRIEIVEHQSDADALLTGAAKPQTGVLRLVDLKTGKPVWTFEYKTAYGATGLIGLFARAHDSRGADNQIADKLIEVFNKK